MFDAGKRNTVSETFVGVADQVCRLIAETDVAQNAIAGSLAPNLRHATAGLNHAGTVLLRDTLPLRLRVTRNGRVHDLAEMAGCLEWGCFVQLPHAERRLYAHTELSRQPMLEAHSGEFSVLMPEYWFVAVQMSLFWLLLQSNALACLHAAVVSVAGTALVVIGPSGAGKSTLSYALAQAGGDYFTDECAWFSLPDLSLHPWLRPLALRPGGLDALVLPDAAPEWHTFKPGDPKWFVAPPSPQCACPSDRVMFVFLEGFGDAPALRPLPGGQATRGLLRGLSCGPVDFGERMALAARMVSRYPCWGLRSGSPAATAALLARHAEEKSA